MWRLWIAKHLKNLSQYGTCVFQTQQVPPPLHLPSFRISEWADTSYKCDTAVLKSDKSVNALVFVRETALYGLRSPEEMGEGWKCDDGQGESDGGVGGLLVGRDGGGDLSHGSVQQWQVPTNAGASSPL